ncbi:MAG TPA: aldehyde dehydrogenase family protein [Acidobacteriota bacterium]|nr:aldehyde dehydrogenase family protein [Acidobacteriota bacterium]
MLSDKDLLSRQQARQLAQKAKDASEILATFSQSQIDAVIDAIAQAADREAETLARMAHEETGYGRISDKVIKNHLASRQVYRFIRPLKTVGVIDEDKERKILMIAEPVGVVAAILPSTNPTSTAIYKTLISVKGRNAIVLSPHPAAKKCICHAADVMAKAAVAAGAPEGTISCLTDVSSEGTQELMRDRNVNVILATGGMGIVRLAYSCGKPAFGVGPGNVPSFIERSANVAKGVSDTLTGKTFDLGVLCSSEQALIYESPIRDQVMAELQRWKVHMLSDQEMEALARVMVTPTFGINPKIVGRPAHYIAQQAGFNVPPETTALIAPLKGVGKEYPLSIEKLSPVLALYEVPDFNSGIETAIKLLRFGGMGHTMSFHSTNRDLIVQAGLRVPVFRLVINSPSTHGSVGLTTGLDPAMTLGCGAVGGNITSDNISPFHLINIKRVAFEIREAQKAAPEAVSYPATQNPRAAESLTDKISKFLDTRLGSSPPPPRPAPTQTPAPPVPATESNSVRFGEHKIYPIHPPEVKAAMIANPQPGPSPVTHDHKPANPGPELIGPVDFVCEDDVRRAIEGHKQIGIHAKTIITPSARDLASNQNVFKKVD